MPSSVQGMGFFCSAHSNQPLQGAHPRRISHGKGAPIGAPYRCPEAFSQRPFYGWNSRRLYSEE